MGNEQPKKGQRPRLNVQQLEIGCLKAVGHLEIQRDRRTNQGMQKEKALISMMGAPQRSKNEELQKCSSIVSDMQFIHGCNKVIGFLNVIKDRSKLICDSVGQPENIKELLPYIESVIWAAKFMNIDALNEFQYTLVNYFGAQGVDVTSNPQVDPEIRKDFETVMPTPQDINDYIVKLSEKSGLTLQQINQAGHEFYQPGQMQQHSQQYQFNQQQQQGSGGNNGVGGFYPPPQGGNGGQGGQGGNGGYGQVYNLNIQLPSNNQQQGQQNQFQQPPGSQQQSNHPSQQQQWNQQPSQQNSQQQSWNQKPDQFVQPNSSQQQQHSQPSNPMNDNNSQQQQQQGHSYPQMSLVNNQQGQGQGQQYPPQQQFYQNNQFPQGQSSYVPNNNNNNSQQQGFNQPPQQNQFNQPPQNYNNNNGGGDDLDSLEARLNRIREGV